VIVVDASALVAILAGEPEADAFIKLLVETPSLLSPLGFWETTVAARRVLGPDGQQSLLALMDALRIEITAAGGETARIAVEAETRFGKRTPARLNLGDCFAYALAKERNLPLLYKGDDFSRTDIEPALPV
jgi:ribonuclease VapC